MTKDVKEKEVAQAIENIKPTNYFTELNSINVGDKVEKKNGLTYLSWAWAWAELKKRYPESNYTIYEDANGNFYHTDGMTAWVKTGVTVNGIEHIEYLPVMDFKNKSIPLAAITSFDVNKAIQRSLTKAVARHGLGLYIYAGEDLPEGDTKTDEPKAPETPKAEPKTATAKPSSVRRDLVDFCNENGIDIKVVAKMFKLNNSATDEAFLKALDYCKAEVKKKVYAEARAQGKVEETTVAEDVLAEAEQFLEGIEEV